MHSMEDHHCLLVPERHLLARKHNPGVSMPTGRSILPVAEPRNADTWSSIYWVHRRRARVDGAYRRRRWYRSRV